MGSSGSIPGRGAHPRVWLLMAGHHRCGQPDTPGGFNVVSGPAQPPQRFDFPGNELRRQESPTQLHSQSSRRLGKAGVGRRNSDETAVRASGVSQVTGFAQSTHWASAERRRCTLKRKWPTAGSLTPRRHPGFWRHDAALAAWSVQTWDRPLRARRGRPGTSDAAHHVPTCHQERHPRRPTAS